MIYFIERWFALSWYLLSGSTKRQGDAMHRSGNGQGKTKFFKVREKSGNFILSQGKLTF